MKIRTINLDEDGLPESITVVMSAREAAFLARVLGDMTGTKAAEIQSDGPTVSGAIYDSVSSLFNAYYGDGVTDVAR